MYSSEDFERLFIRYKSEVYLLMKVSSYAIGGAFTALRRCLHRPAKVSS